MVLGSTKCKLMVFKGTKCAHVVFWDTKCIHGSLKKLVLHRLSVAV
jgi:hypothetical protein